jgi:hypothetical protein
MDDDSAEFAKQLLNLVGEDRFYHALLRWGRPREAKLIHLAFGGTQDDWVRKCHELRLVAIGEDIMSFPVRPGFNEGEAHEVLCRVAYTLSLHHKEYAGRSPVLPAAIHARMLLDRQNEWTNKYAENLSKHEGKP